MAIDPDVQLLLDALEARIEALENQPTDPNLAARVSALEVAINLPINPHTVIQQYDDNSEIIYEKK
jgi:hypothetical protein